MEDLDKVITSTLHLVTLTVLSLHIKLFIIRVRLVPGSLVPESFQNKFIFIGLTSEICFQMSQNSDKTIPASYTTVTNSALKLSTMGPCTQFLVQVWIQITDFVLISADKKPQSFQSILGRGGGGIISINRQIRTVALLKSLCTRTILEGVTIKCCFAILVQHLTVLLLMCELLCC